MLDFPRINKPNFNNLEWTLPIEDFTEVGLRKSANKFDVKYFIKFMIDILFSFIFLICTLPFFIIFGILIKLTSKGPILFKQERVGLDGKLFKIIKFRTMHENAEKALEELQKFNELNGPTFKITNDPRVTKVGKFLRKTSLDELPQFWNIIKQDMSLIGPRPPLEKEVRQYENWQTRRLSVKPGLTCIWQVQPNRHNITFEKWMKMDLDYIDNWNLKKDVKIFINTIKTVIRADSH